MTVAEMNWNAYVHLAFDEIRIAGARSPQVTRRLMAALEDLHQIAPPERRSVLELQLKLLCDGVARSTWSNRTESSPGARRSRDRHGGRRRRCNAGRVRVENLPESCARATGHDSRAWSGLQYGVQCPSRRVAAPRPRQRRVGRATTERAPGNARRPGAVMDRPASGRCGGGRAVKPCSMPHRMAWIGVVTPILWYAERM